MTNKEIQALPTIRQIRQMGLSIATESFIWSIYDDPATTRIIAVHIKEKDDEIAKLKAQLNQITKAWTNFIIRLEQIAGLDPSLDREIDDEFSEQIINMNIAIVATENE